MHIALAEGKHIASIFSKYGYIAFVSDDGFDETNISLFADWAKKIMSNLFASRRSDMFFATLKRDIALLRKSAIYSLSKKSECDMLTCGQREKRTGKFICAFCADWSKFSLPPGGRWQANA